MGWHRTGFSAPTSVRESRRSRPDAVITVEDGIGRSTVYELLRLGTLPSVRIGACRRVPAEAVHSFVANLRATAS
jgi:excisionase family DNA binding protein